MLLIEKSEIEIFISESERLKPLQETKEDYFFEEGRIAALKYLLAHSKEVEVLELRTALTEFLIDPEKYGSYNQFLNENGYKLIKIK